MSDVSENPASAQPGEADIALFRAIGTSRHAHEGEYLYREGDVSYDFFVVVSAEVDIIVRADGADRIVGHYGAGRFLGELNTLTSLRVFVSARVTKPGEVIAVPRERLRTVMTTNARLGDTILAAFTARRSLLLECRELFSFIGADPASGWLSGCAALDDRGFVLTDAALTKDLLGETWAGLGRGPLPFETSRPGLFAVGDLRSESVKRVASAVGEGSAAVRAVHQHLAFIS
jgi:CRP-like cAMP-binding protein